MDLLLEAAEQVSNTTVSLSLTTSTTDTTRDQPPATTPETTPTPTTTTTTKATKKQKSVNGNERNKEEEGTEGGKTKGGTTEGGKTEGGKRKSEHLPWPDSYKLIKLVHAHGKNWGKVLEELHRSHLGVNLRDKDEVRVKFNTLNNKNSMVRKGYRKAKLANNSKRGASEEQLRKMEQEHALREEQTEKQYEKALKLLEEIEQREHLPSSETQTTEQAVRESMQKKAQERKEVRNERMEKILQEAEEEKTLKKKLASTLDVLTGEVGQLQNKEDRLLSILEQYVNFKMSQSQTKKGEQDCGGK